MSELLRPPNSDNNHESKILDEVGLSALPFDDRLEKMSEIWESYDGVINDAVWESVKSMDDVGQRCEIENQITPAARKLFQIALGVDEWRAHNKFLKLKRGSGEKQLDKGIISTEKLINVGSDLLIKEFYLKGGGIPSLEMALEEAESLGVFESEIEFLLKKSKKRSEKLSRSDDFSEFGYKKDTNNLRSHEQASVLRQLVESGWSNEGGKTPVGRVSGGLLKGYINNPKKLYGKKERTPGVALTHDLFFAASSTGDSIVFHKVGNKISKWWNKKESMFAKEWGDNLFLSTLETLKRGIEISTQHDWTGVAEISKESVQSNNPFSEETPYAVGVHTDRGDISIAFKARGKSGLLKYFEDRTDVSNYSREVEEIKRISENQISLENADHIGITLSNALMGSFPKFNLLRSLVDTHFTSQEEFEKKNEDLVGSSGARIASYDDILSLSKDAPYLEAYKVDYILGEIRHLSDVEENQTEEMLIETKSQRSQVFLKNPGMISEAGHIYHSSTDKELRKYKIESLSLFRVDDVKSRIQAYGESSELSRVMQAYKVRLKFSQDFLKDDRVLDLTVSLNGLLMGDGERINVPKWISAHTERLILDRLDYSTRRGEWDLKEGWDDDGQERDVFSDAHWRTLPSPPFHLRSSAAIKHAGEILDETGIDIYKRILHRRKMGLMAPNVVETYVRESEKSRTTLREKIFDESKLGELTA